LPDIIEVSVRTDDVCDELNEFISPAKAEEYFYRLARKRTRCQSHIIATVNGEWRMIYRIDDVYSGNRWQLSLDLITGLPVKRRYVPSNDELTGRKAKVSGIVLPPIKITHALHAQLQEQAHRAGKTLNEIRKQAYKNFLNSGDTILSDIMGD